MSRSVEVYIEKLVLYGMDSVAGSTTSVAIEAELSQLLNAHGTPASWRPGASSMKLADQVAHVPESSAEALANNVAHAIYRGS